MSGKRWASYKRPSATEARRRDDQEISEQLFDVSKTTPTACPVPGCGAIRFPNQAKVPTCQVDRERATAEWVRRPAACLNHAPDPRFAEIPF